MLIMRLDSTAYLASVMTGFVSYVLRNDADEPIRQEAIKYLGYRRYMFPRCFGTTEGMETIAPEDDTDIVCTPGPEAVGKGDGYPTLSLLLAPCATILYCLTVITMSLLLPYFILIIFFVTAYLYSYGIFPRH